MAELHDKAVKALLVGGGKLDRMALSHIAGAEDALKEAADKIGAELFWEGDHVGVRKKADAEVSGEKAESAVREEK